MPPQGNVHWREQLKVTVNGVQKWRQWIFFSDLHCIAIIGTLRIHWWNPFLHCIARILLSYTLKIHSPSWHNTGISSRSHSVSTVHTTTLRLLTHTQFLLYAQPLSDYWHTLSFPQWLCRSTWTTWLWLIQCSHVRWCKTLYDAKQLRHCSLILKTHQTFHSQSQPVKMIFVFQGQSGI